MQAYLVGTVVIVVLVLGLTVASKNEPVLGLDLQGGISAVYSPVGNFSTSSLDEAVNIIRSRADGFGASEAEIDRQGDTISVDLPGVKNRDKALRIVGQTAELRFRPVLAELPAAGKMPSTTTTAPASTTTVAGAANPESTSPSSTTTTTLSTDDAAIKAAVASCDTSQVAALFSARTAVPNTERADDKRKSCVVLPVRSGQSGAPRLYLGPTKFTGKGVDDAKSRFAQGEGYTVDMSLNDTGRAGFNELAGTSFPKAPPQNEVAIVLDGVVQSHPAFREASYPSGNVQISGSFTPSEAEDLAAVIKYGALPVELKRLTVTSVAPTLGQDQLDAGIAAGIIGLVLVALYMVAYYRLLGLVVIAGLLVSGVITYGLVSYLGTLDHPVVLTIAGVTGLIVSIGVTVDSYVVYFERLKDEVRTGRTVRASVDRGFTRSFRTIVAADLVSLIGALALYLIAVGSVKGFAFFLLISTILDLLVSYFFMHPVVSLMSRRPALVRMRGVGIAAGLDEPGVVA